MFMTNTAAGANVTVAAAAATTTKNNNSTLFLW
jgi:hypothetical protein